MGHPETESRRKEVSTNELPHHVGLKEARFTPRSSLPATDHPSRESSRHRTVIELDDIDNIEETHGQNTTFQAGYDAAMESMKRKMEQCGIPYNYLRDSTTTDTPA